MNLNSKTESQHSFPGAVPAAFPANENERIQELLGYRVLDTSPETSYDDIAKLAAYICGTATSLVPKFRPNEGQCALDKKLKGLPKEEK